MFMSKTALYLVYFCAYSLVLIVIGKGALRGGNSLRAYFICDRSVSLPMCVCTFTGTWVSAITILSLTGSVYEYGISSLIYSVLPWFLGAFILACVTRQLYHHDIITVPEFFWCRYGSRGLQFVYGIIFMLVYTLYLVAQYKGFGLVAAEMFDIPYPVAVGMIYLFIIYTTFGGYRSVVRTDFFNLVLLVISLGVICATILSQVGGVARLFEQAGQISGSAYGDTSAAEGVLFSLFSERYTPLTSISMFCGWGLGLAANPQYIVRLLGAKNDRVARNTIFVSLMLLTVIIIMLVLIGLGMRILIPTLPTKIATDGIFIRLINNELYSPWSGFFLFSVLGACISTANSQLLIIASSFSYDIIYPIVSKPLRERQVVFLGRMAILVCGTLSMLLTLNPPEFTLSYGGDIWGIISVLLFPPMYGTLLCKRITRRGVWACIIAGTVAIALFYPPYQQHQLQVHPAMFGVIISTAAMLLVSWLDWRKEGEQG